MTFEEFLSNLSHNAFGKIQFNDGTVISEEKFSNRFQQYFDGTIDSLINCEKATKGWADIFNSIK